MNTLETSDMILSEPAAKNPSRPTSKRPWYVWLCAASALLIAALYGFFAFSMGGLPRELVSLNGLASLLAVALPPVALAASVCVVLKQALGKTLLFVLGLATTGLGLIGLLYMIGIMSAGYSSGYAIRLMSGFLLLILGLYTAVLAWLTFATLWRQSARFAWTMLIALALPLVLILWSVTRVFLM